MDELTRRNFLRYAKGASAVLSSSFFLSSCASDTTVTAARRSEDVIHTGEEDGKPRLGLALPSTRDYQGSMRVRITTHAAKLWDAHLSVLEHNYETADLMAAVGELAGSGASAIVCAGLSTESFSAVLDFVEDKHIYLALCEAPKDVPEDLVKRAEASIYFVGTVSEDEKAATEALAKVLLEDKKRRHIGLITWSMSDVKSVARTAALQEKVVAFNQKDSEDQAGLSDPSYARNSGEAARSVSTLLETYPDLDALYVAGDGGDQLMGAMAQLDNASLADSVCIATRDISDELIDYMAEGHQAVALGGSYIDAMVALSLAFKAYQNSDTTETKDASAEIVLKPHLLDSAEAAEAFSKTYQDMLPLTDDEIKGLPTQDVPSLQAMLENLA